MFYNILEVALETARLAALRPEREALQASTAGGAWRRQTTTLLAKFGFKRLGSGAGGIAYGHPTYPYIIKAYRADAGFDSWMRFVRGQADNPWVPHMRGKNIRIGTTTFVRLERLQPLKPNGWAFNTAMDLRYAFELMVNRPDDYTQKLNAIQGQRRAIIGERISEIESDEDLYAILTFFRQHPAQWLDLHMGNWMTRGSDELVIIDPLFARKPLRSLEQAELAANTNRLVVDTYTGEGLFLIVNGKLAYHTALDAPGVNLDMLGTGLLYHGSKQAWRTDHDGVAWCTNDPVVAAGYSANLLTGGGGKQCQLHALALRDPKLLTIAAHGAVVPQNRDTVVQQALAQGYDGVVWRDARDADYRADVYCVRGAHLAKRATIPLALTELPETSVEPLYDALEQHRVADALRVLTAPARRFRATSDDY